MRKSLWMVVCVGLAFGCTDSQTSAQAISPVTDGTMARFEVVAVQGGGCDAARACRSFRLSQTGAYTYTAPGFFGQNPQQTTGVLQGADWLALTQSITQDRLAALETSKFTGACPAHFDGEDYTFTIILDGSETRLYSCEHALSDDPMSRALTDLFDVFARTLAAQ